MNEDTTLSQMNMHQLMEDYTAIVGDTGNYVQYLVTRQKLINQMLHEDFTSLN